MILEKIARRYIAYCDRKRMRAETARAWRMRLAELDEYKAYESQKIQEMQEDMLMARYWPKKTGEKKCINTSLERK
jgi:hypothetical protein